jgi:hypothetical protein
MTYPYLQKFRESLSDFAGGVKVASLQALDGQVELGYIKTTGGEVDRADIVAG